MRRILTPFKPKSTKLEAAELLHTLAETRGEGLPHHAHICVTSCRPERHQQTACFGPWTAQPPFARRSGAGRAVPLPHLNNGAMGQVCAAGGCGQALTDTVRTHNLQHPFFSPAISNFLNGTVFWTRGSWSLPQRAARQPVEAGCH